MIAPQVQVTFRVDLADAEARAFEISVLEAGLHWDSFQLTPTGTGQRHGEFVVGEDLYEEDGPRLEAWLRAHPAVSEIKVRRLAA